MKIFLMADHTKYGKIALIKVVNIEKFNAIITDSLPPEDVLESLKEKRIEIIS
jgi:DeoR/GlpR family transcriptional regulator of sugar metabolism